MAPNYNAYTLECRVLEIVPHGAQIYVPLSFVRSKIVVNKVERYSFVTFVMNSIPHFKFFMNVHMCGLKG